jgi:hypothetical protein
VKPGFIQCYFDRFPDNAGMVGPGVGYDCRSIKVNAMFCLCRMFSYRQSLVLQFGAFDVFSKSWWTSGNPLSQHTLCLMSRGSVPGGPKVGCHFVKQFLDLLNACVLQYLPVWVGSL